MTRCGTIALVGRPNVGKSSLMNALVGEHLAIVSAKPQSTRAPVVGLLSRDDTQFIFTDCPGLLEPEYPLHEAMRDAARAALGAADVIAHLHPLADRPAPSVTQVAALERAPRAPVVTVYTKADLVPAAARRPLAPGQDEIAVSTIGAGEGLDALLAMLARRLPLAPFLYPADDLAAQPLRFFAVEFIREAAFELLAQELPYSLTAEIDEFREGETPVYIRATVFVERESQKAIVVGREGRGIKALGTAARGKIEVLIGRPVFLDLRVKVLPQWRRQVPALKRLGYMPS